MYNVQVFIEIILICSFCTYAALFCIYCVFEVISLMVHPPLHIFISPFV